MKKRKTAKTRKAKVKKVKARKTVARKTVRTRPVKAAFYTAPLNAVSSGFNGLISFFK
ncbi:MAG: hypothetical protein JW772_00285 [Candidatus Diapherotrites archaeon]|nr:hypothetical protein [Candidatus Diapherotrites archaeon]